MISAPDAHPSGGHTLTVSVLIVSAVWVLLMNMNRIDAA